MTTRSTGTTANGTATGLTTSWLAARMGVQPAHVESLRRSGELLAVRRADGQHVYPAWQFGRDGRPLDALPRIIGAARRAGVADERVHEILSSRIGLTGDRRLLDELRDGHEDEVLRAIASAR